MSGTEPPEITAAKARLRAEFLALFAEHHPDGAATMDMTTVVEQAWYTAWKTRSDREIEMVLADRLRRNPSLGQRLRAVLFPD